MTTSSPKEYRALVLGDLWEIDDIFGLEIFHKRFQVEAIYVDELAEFQEAIEDPTIDVVIIDVEPHGLDVLEIVFDNPPLRPVIMVADAEQADVIIEAKKKGLERYVIRLEDGETNIALLCQEIRSVFEQIIQPPTMKAPTTDFLLRYAHYHNVRQPFFIVDLHRRLLYVNAAGVKMVEQLKGQNAGLGASTEDFYLDESPERFNAHLDRAFRDETVEVTQTFENLPAGERDRQILYQPIRQNGNNIIAVSIACKNIGPRREAEERLEAREKSLWGYFDTVPLPLNIVGDDLIIEHCNPAFANLIEHDGTEGLEGRSIRDIVHPEDQEDVERALKRLFDGRDSYFQAEHRYCNDEGHVIWVNRIGCALINGEETVTHALVVAVDVTRRKEAEQRAERSMRMEAIGELAGGVAHDFNNILAIVTSIGHVLKAKLDQLGEDELVGYVDRIDQAVKSGTTLTQQLLSFSSKKHIEQQVTDLNEHIREICKLLSRALGDEIEMELDLSPDLAPINLGKGQIDQVTMNLAVNARDAMPEGGVVHIGTRQVHVDLDHPPPRQDIETGDWVVLEVSDTGVGMDRETRRRIFDPFYTTKAPGEGTGMGLANIYQIVERSGGKIYVDSSPDQGTTFTLYFPAADRSELDHHGGEAGESVYPPETPTTGCILVVEDEDDIREPYRLFLENEGYQVIDAQNIEQAWEIIEGLDSDIDVLLADVILPDGSGVDLAKELQARVGELEIVFMSGYAPDLIYRREEEFEERWRFLPKPVSRDTLVKAVHQAMQRAQSR